MALKHNAESQNDKDDLKALRKAWGAKFIKDNDINIEFGPNIMITVGSVFRRASRTRWDTWVAEGFPITEEADEFPLPSLTAEARRQRKAETSPPTEPVPPTVEAVKARPEQRKAAPVVEPSGGFLDDLAHRALEVGMLEREGETGRNAARFKRGDLMIEVADIARVSSAKIKDILHDLNDRTLELAESNAIIGYEPITEQEASRTRKVVEAFGSSGEFRLVNAVNRVTGEPLVMDDGQPPLMSLTDVALNKLEPLAGLASNYMEEALSFAYRHTEKVVRKVKSVAGQTDKSIISVLRAVDKARVKSAHPLTGEVIEVQPEGREAIDFLGAMVGEAPTPDIVSIKTSRGFYESFFEPLKQLMSAVASRFNPSLVAADADGQVSNVFLLEMTLAQYFNVHEDAGVKTTLGAMVRGEAITQAQAEQFLDAYAFDPDLGEWLQVKDLAEDSAEAAAYDDESWDDDDDDDDEWEL